MRDYRSELSLWLLWATFVLGEAIMFAALVTTWVAVAFGLHAVLTGMVAGEDILAAKAASMTMLWCAFIRPMQFAGTVLERVVCMVEVEIGDSDPIA